MKEIIKLIILFLAFNLFSCKQKEDVKIFDFYNSQNLLVKKNSYKSVINGDSVSIYNDNKRMFSFSYINEKDGIYIFSNNKKIPIYYFTKKVLERDDSLLPFLPHKVRLLDKKYYETNENEKFLIYSFVESTGDEIYYTYYMEGEGFICVYKYDEDKYLYSNSPKAKKVANLFLKDTLFFAKLNLEDKERKLKQMMNVVK